jgi:uroporphyrinogen decarboxylase
MARGFCAKNTNTPVRSFYSDPEKSFESQMWVKQMFSNDQNLRLSPALGTWEFGGEIKMPSGGLDLNPTVLRYPALPDIKRVGWAPSAIKFSKLQQDAGLTTTVRSGSPFTTAEQVCGTDLLIRWIAEKPELAHRILQMVTDYCINITQYWVETFGVENVEPQIGASKESNTLISPSQFLEFALPYAKKLYEKILGMGVKQIFTHLCGDQNLNLPYWAEISFGDPGMVSVGHEVDLNTAIEYFGKSCIIIGNVNTQVLETGTPQQVYEQSIECIEKGKKAPRGFILTPACELPPASPSCNVWAMKKAINDFGWYE